MEIRPDELVLKGSLPKSAKAFEAYHAQKDLQIPIEAFVTLLRSRVCNLYESDTAPQDILPQQLFDQATSLYYDVDFKDNPLYKRSIRNLEILTSGIGRGRLVMYGRDADYLAAAVVAHEFGRTPIIGRPTLLSISSQIGYGLAAHPDRLEVVKKLFEQYGIDRDFIHVDIGKYGNIPKSIMKALWPELSTEEINARIRLVDPYHRKQMIANVMHASSSISQAGKAKRAIEADPSNMPIIGIGEVKEAEDLFYEMGYKAIESRPHTTKQAKSLEEDPETGWVRVKREPASKTEQLLAWVVNQAVVRSFLPRAPKNPFWKKFLRV